MRRLFESFGHALAGCAEAFSSQRNFRVHAGFAVAALALGVLLGLSPLEWLVLAITIALVLSTEMVNTSLEALVDLVSPEVHDKARVAKDVAAGAVLLMALLSIIVGLVLFLPKLSLLRGA